MIKLTREQVVLLHAQLIRETGGSDGIRDECLLDSALHTSSAKPESRITAPFHNTMWKETCSVINIQLKMMHSVS